MAKENPQRMVSIQTVDDTKAITPEVLESERQEIIQKNGSDAIFQQLQIEDSLTQWDSLAFGKIASYTVGDPKPLFARLDTESIMKEVMEERAKNAETKPQGVSFLEEISIDDFAKVDLRVAKIEECIPVKKSKKLLQLTLNDGSGKQRTVCSGISPWYTPDDLIGKSIILVANLKPATLCGVESQGMILAADSGKNDVKVIFVDGIEPGSKVR